MTCQPGIEPGCPAPKAHQRIEEAHRLWHQAADHYANPDSFRERLNGALKAMRGGAWALQQHSRGRRGFQEWHDEWHQRIRGDEVLTWLLQARRHSLAEDDLAPASSAQVSLMASASGGLLAQFSVPPFVEPAQVPSRLRETRMGALVKEAAVMVLERRWSAADLDRWELLDALAHCYGLLAEPLDQAHGKAPPAEDQVEDPLKQLLGIPPGQPPCMALSRRDRTTVFRLKDGRVLEQDDAVGDELAGERPQGNAPTEKPKDDEPTAADAKPDPLRRIAWHFEEARRSLIREGALPQRVSLFVPGQEWVPLTLTPAEAQDRYQLWSRIAREVERSRAQAVMTSFEVPARKPGESSRLVLAAETSDGQHRTCSATFERRAGQLRFGRTRVNEDGRRWYFLDPVRTIWRRPA
ncbi:MAG: hypothetical protein JO247_19870 [Chloroflexi bacterium]|nr:hypothetical protein [Chloroflexota bacterium]